MENLKAAKNVCYIFRCFLCIYALFMHYIYVTYCAIII